MKKVIFFTLLSLILIFFIAQKSCVPEPIPPSCEEIFAKGITQSGTYTIDPDGTQGPIAPLQVYCDMVTNGGGWTQITPQLAHVTFGGKMVADDPAATEGIDSMDRPYTRDKDDCHSYEYTFNIPFGYQEFFFSDYNAKANSGSSHTSEIYPSKFKQTDWKLAYNSTNNVGDISFGSPNDAGPVASYAREYTANKECTNCDLPWPPGNTKVYSLSAPAYAFRISWGECGTEYEGWYPWYSGFIYVR